ncbi:hypothetical protein OG209_04995 [Streptomyces sp. NBC_01383]|uniref:hypothetical protein n=1 Tax=Streptomyces sp. NBC_01383 TaxID=2903846 RepID=UPI00324D25C7
MTDADLRSLGIEPAALDPAPPWTPRWEAAIERLRARHPCLLCGQRSSAAGVAEVAEHGRLWVDRCMPCLVATTPRGGPQAPVEDTVTALHESAREAGVALTIVTDGE